MLKSFRVIVEFQDCVIEANDLLDYQILVDDDLNRAKKTNKAL